jgi:hypothetical protein
MCCPFAETKYEYSTVHRDAASTADFTWQAHTLQSTMRCTATWCIHANNRHVSELSGYAQGFAVSREAQAGEGVSGMIALVIA